MYFKLTWVPLLIRWINKTRPGIVLFFVFKGVLKREFSRDAVQLGWRKEMRHWCELFSPNSRKQFPAVYMQFSGVESQKECQRSQKVRSSVCVRMYISAGLFPGVGPYSAAPVFPLWCYYGVFRLTPNKFSTQVEAKVLFSANILNWCF